MKAQRIRRWWQRNERIIQTIFMISVILFVIFALGNFFKTVDWHQVGHGLASLSPMSIAIMLVLGCVAVTPMLGYDFALVHLLRQRNIYSPSYIIRSGWITNTLTNIAGFGGLLGATLRAYFYGKKASKTKILLAISKIAIFLLSGLSVLCWLALALIFSSHSGGTHLARYTIWLIGGGCYFPIIFAITQFHDSKIFHDLTLKLELGIVSSSTLEWLFVSLFFILIGYLMGVKTNFVAVLPMYIVAEIIGVVSMVPGALGSFDFIMLMELSLLGVARYTAVVWLLLFRVFYYIVPVLIGGILALTDLGNRFNQYFDDLPRQGLHKLSHGLLTAFMYASGVMMLIAASLPDLTNSNKFLMRVYPFTFFFFHQLTTVLFAIALLACARGVEARLKKAYWPTLILLLIGIINTLWNLGTWSLTIYLAIVLLMVLFSHKTLYREKFVYSMSKMIIDGTIFMGSLILYIIIGIINRSQYLATHHIPGFLIFPGEKIWLSGLIGLLLGLLVMFLIMHYFTSTPDPFSGFDSVDSGRVLKVIQEFGGNETSHLAFLNDKRIYYYRANDHDQLFFMFRPKYDKLIVMGEPVGNQQYIRQACRQFMEEADRFGYQTVFYEVGPATTMLLHEFGFDFFKTGEDGLVKLADFTLAGKRQRSQRALMHKFDREGYQFSIVQPPFDSKLLGEMKIVSDEWLGKDVEKGFSLGFFSAHYINQAPVALVRDKAGILVAFATFMPTGSKKILTIDLMRHSSEAPSGIMDEIFVHMFQYGQQHDYQYFDLGMAPLANVGESQFSFFEEKVAHFIYEYGYNLYGFQGLRHYKAKYTTSWEPRYIVYRRKNSLITTMLAVVSVINQRAKVKEQQFNQ